ncbi:hypothetical protein VNO80_29274 [Phaseolus coccineus]|uniref:Uncharacterized protein n=1 Tax=Phaseolus coccineus TaxID=3886 RepID=A0AAN9LB52_PHACN
MSFSHSPLFIQTCSDIYIMEFLYVPPLGYHLGQESVHLMKEKKGYHAVLTVLITEHKLVYEEFYHKLMKLKGKEEEQSAERDRGWWGRNHSPTSNAEWSSDVGVDVVL